MHEKIDVREHCANQNIRNYNSKKYGCEWRVCFRTISANPLSNKTITTYVSNQHTNRCSPGMDQLVNGRNRSGDYVKSKNILFEQLGGTVS